MALEEPELVHTPICLFGQHLSASKWHESAHSDGHLGLPLGCVQAIGGHVLDDADAEGLAALEEEGSAAQAMAKMATIRNVKRVTLRSIIMRKER